MQLAKRNLLKAEYDREAAEVGVKTILGDLCVAAGLPANTPLQIAVTEPPVSTAELRGKAAKLIDETLASRPDLAARAAEVRASEAAIRKARADFLPEIKLQGQYAYSTFGYDANDGKVHGRFTEDINGYGALLVAKWDLFDGFERLERLRRKSAEMETAQEELELARLDATRDVWSAYQQTLSAASRVEYSESFVASARETNNAVRTAYESGLSTVAEITQAAGELGLARSPALPRSPIFPPASPPSPLATGLPKSCTTEPPQQTRQKRNSLLIPAQTDDDLHGYSTYFSGKWHLGDKPDIVPARRSSCAKGSHDSAELHFQINGRVLSAYLKSNIQPNGTSATENATILASKPRVIF